MAVNNRGYRERVQRKRSLIAPILGLADPKDRCTRVQSWMDQSPRKMEFPSTGVLAQETWSPGSEQHRPVRRAAISLRATLVSDTVRPGRRNAEGSDRANTTLLCQRGSELLHGTSGNAAKELTIPDARLPDCKAVGRRCSFSADLP